MHTDRYPDTTYIHFQTYQTAISMIKNFAKLRNIPKLKTSKCTAIHTQNEKLQETVFNLNYNIYSSSSKNYHIYCSSKFIMGTYPY